MGLLGPVLAWVRAPPRRAGRHDRPSTLRRVRHQPRPCRQHPGRSTPARRGGTRRSPPPPRRGVDPPVAVHPDAVHGRGVRRDRTVPVLHRPWRPRPRRGGAAGTPARVRRCRLGRRRRRSGRPGDVRWCRARDRPRRSGTAPLTPRAVPRVDPCAALASDPHGPGRAAVRLVRQRRCVRRPFDARHDGIPGAELLARWRQPPSARRGRCGRLRLRRPDSGAVPDGRPTGWPRGRPT